MARGLAVTGDVNAAAQQIKSLYNLFDKSDCTMVEVRGPRPRCVVEAGRGVCASMRMLVCSTQVEACSVALTAIRNSPRCARD